MKKYEDIIKTAVGFNQERGDRVEVTNVPFEAIDIMQERREMKAEASRQFYLSVIKYLFIGVMIILSFIFIVKPILQWLTTLGQEIPPPGMFPKTVLELEEAIAGVPPPQKITKEEFTWDAQGNLITQKFYKGAELLFTLTFTWNAEGTLNSVTRS